MTPVPRLKIALKRVYETPAAEDGARRNRRFHRETTWQSSSRYRRWASRSPRSRSATGSSRPASASRSTTFPRDRLSSNAPAFIRSRVAARSAEVADGLQILYGGSVKGSNAAELFGMPDIDGGLIGGASLQADEFLTICKAGG